MATERFFRLPEEKQRSILNAAIKEFAKVPMDKVSINKIIQDADISRGSFYTYFEDKTDILRFIFKDGQRHMKDFCIAALTKNKGDIWGMLEDFFYGIITYCFQGELADFFNNILEGARAEEFFNGFGCDLHMTRENERLEHWLYENMDHSQFKLQTFEGFHRFLEIAMSIIIGTLKEYRNGNMSIEAAREDYHHKLQMLRYGVCKR